MRFRRRTRIVAGQLNYKREQQSDSQSELTILYRLSGAKQFRLTVQKLIIIRTINNCRSLFASHRARIAGHTRSGRIECVCFDTNLWRRIVNCCFYGRTDSFLFKFLKQQESYNPNCKNGGWISVHNLYKRASGALNFECKEVCMNCCVTAYLSIYSFWTILNQKWAFETIRTPVLVHCNSILIFSVSLFFNLFFFQYLIAIDSIDCYLADAIWSTSHNRRVSTCFVRIQANPILCF